MVRVSLLIISLLTSTCYAASQTAAQQVQAFYTMYLNAWVADETPDLHSSEMQQYVAEQTLDRLAELQSNPNDNNLASDYFTYTQDYDPSWVAALKVGKAALSPPFTTVDVWLGIEGGRHRHLRTWLQQEQGSWKIVRVKDIDNNYQQQLGE
ncbi:MULTISPECIES: DUF3828 domain-containing protein [unclassified Erwinia]|uniref:DUF3828 domain-containing protein n=1 Tax=unclassified Erwinia TaxID=2622719 RepID=UPI0006FA00EF|nr:MULTISPECIES: DUF3828 domain-containing protein [unclassified Erwinia]KQN57745.1 hypothetical protein ASF13_02820 [Erwinia sp. Leaf53]PLV45433.1 hypothetical protein NV64_22000 [Erwinia sp. B116]